VADRQADPALDEGPDRSGATGDRDPGGKRPGHGSRLPYCGPMRQFAATSLSLLLLGLLPAAALGEEKRKDALIDPNSPAGTEYAIPFERAREEAGGGSGRRGGGDVASGKTRGTRKQVQKGAADLGTGVESTNKRSRGKGNRRGKIRADRSRPVTGPQSAPRLERSAVQEARTDVSAAVWTLGLPLGVVLAGGLIGFGLRRQRTRL
jgi:hypothetical protein